MPGQHAKLSASGSYRWLACPGSIVLEAQFADRSSSYADEGTRAHAVAEARLKALFSPEKPELQAPEEAVKDGTEPEMWAFVGRYVDYCKDLVDTMKLRGVKPYTFVEQRVSYDEWAPEGFGTVDFIAIGGTHLDIVDLKYGKGVPVYAEGNPQPRMYALGALHEFGTLWDLETVTVHIVQPRLDNISEETLSVAELLDWARTEVKPKAKIAFEGTREFSAGEHCGFCRARSVCKPRADQLLGGLSGVLDRIQAKNSAVPW